MDSQSAFSTRRIAITGALIAITIILGWPINAPPLNALGFIVLGAAISFTFIHVPTIIGAVEEGPIVGFIVGLAFGLFSLFNAAQSTNAADQIFRDPIISVLPRLLIGPAAWLVYNALKSNPYVALVAAAITGTLTNTLLVVGAIAVRLQADFFAIMASILVNVGIELVVAVILVLAVVSALRGLQIGKRASTV
jgi:uncharacterized membrane protein